MMVDLRFWSSWHEIVKEFLGDYILVEVEGLYELLKKIRRDVIEEFLSGELKGDFDPSEALPPWVCYCYFNRYSYRLEQYYEVLKGECEYMSRKYGFFFFRTDSVSPKDVAYEWSTWFLDDMLKLGIAPVPDTMDNAVILNNTYALMLMLIGSARVLREPFKYIILRQPLFFKHEFRIFVKNGTPRLITWYYAEESIRDRKYYEYVVRVLVNRWDNEVQPIIDKVVEAGVKDFTMDVGFPRNYWWCKQGVWEQRWALIELNPFPRKDNPHYVYPGLFEKDFWAKLEEAEANNHLIIRTPAFETTDKVR